MFPWNVKGEDLTASSGSEHDILVFHVSFLKLMRCAMMLKKKNWRDLKNFKLQLQYTSVVSR